jgi:hypothetical protein
MFASGGLPCKKATSSPNDEKQSDWAGDENARRFPSIRNLAEETKWYETHAYPGSDAPAEKKKLYYSDLFKQTDTWIKTHPNSYYIWFDRLQALDYLDDSTPGEIESCIAKMLAIAHADKGPEPLDFTTDFQILLVLYNKKLQPRLQLEIAQKGLEELAIEAKQPPDDRYSSKKDIEGRGFWIPYNKFSCYLYEADANVRLLQAGSAQDALAGADAALRALKSQVSGDDDFRKAYARQESSYWLAEARLAQLRGHTQDAMAYYESALLARLDSGSTPATGEKDDLAHDAHQLWATLGGSDESWTLWYTRRADAIVALRHLTWEQPNVPLPPFQLADLQGKTWKLADLKGKVVFLNFWASY